MLGGTDTGSYGTGRLMALHWIELRNGSAMTAHREFTIERLPNGYSRLFDYMSGMSSLHTSAADAKRKAQTTHDLYRTSEIRGIL
jgi:hypothetical protein